MLKNLKLMLGIDVNDTSMDDKLKLIIATVSARLKLLLGGVEPPESMDHIILEVSIIRYNKIGSEGMASHAVEGESQSFSEDDFAAFADEIQAYLDTQKDNKRGKVCFL